MQTGDMRMLAVASSMMMKTYYGLNLDEAINISDHLISHHRQQQ